MNLFLASTKRAAEDRFTAHWVALLNLVPGLGQSVLDRIATLGNLPSARFLGAEDHPRLHGQNHPDCRIRTDQYDIYCEHKLSALLGETQLERYSASSPKGSFVILISADTCRVNEELLSSKTYVYPRHSSRPPHYLWRDFYELVEGSKIKLAKQFAEYMHVLGMNPTFWGQIGDPFVEPAAGNAFRGLYDSAIQSLRRDGIGTLRRNDSLGLQIKHAHSRVPLIYVAPAALAGDCDVPYPGRLLRTSVWTTGEGRRVVSAESGFVPKTKRLLYAHSWTIRTKAAWRQGLYSERDYFIPLSDLLIDDLALATKRMEHWIWRIVDHVRLCKDATFEEWVD